MKGNVMPLPDAVRAFEVTTGRLRARVLESGSVDSPTLVLVHGNVSSARFFAESMVELGRRWHCVAVDLRGFGGSEPVPVVASRGIQDFSDDLHAVLSEGLGVGPVHLLGWSLGGAVVMRYAMDHPVASLVLESPMSPFGFGGTKDAEGTPCWPDFAGSGGGTANPELVRRLAAGDRSDEDATSPRNVLTTLYVAPPFSSAVVDDLVDGMVEMAIGDDHYPGDAVASENWPGTAPGERGVNNAISPKYCDLSDFGDVVDGPEVMWIRGDADQIVSDTSLVDFGYLGQIGAVPGWPGVEVFPPQPMIQQIRTVLDRYGRYSERVFAGCGHSPHLERPAEFVALVDDFLAARVGA
jgi:pimeloyl-ACP methyl ester carboxylesterase